MIAIALTVGIALPLMCRSWGCDYCQPRRKRMLVDLAKSGHPNRLVTLTVSAASGSDRADRARKLAHAWRIVAQRWRRLNPTQTLEYLAVFEATKLGEPHLHVLCRSGYIAQRWLSAQMASLISAPIVDIRKIGSAAHAAHYVTKYIGKAPERFATCKRYWHTRGYAEQDKNATESATPWVTPWCVDPRPLSEILHDWTKLHRHPQPYFPWCLTPDHARSLDEVRYGTAPS